LIQTSRGNKKFVVTVPQNPLLQEILTKKVSRVMKCLSMLLGVESELLFMYETRTLKMYEMKKKCDEEKLDIKFSSRYSLQSIAQ
jgi:hypothetical protein